MGRADGLCQGLGGSMHLVDTEHGLMGATGVVGGNIPIALGSALAARLRGGDQVAVVFFGDGAVQAGIFNESVNLATLWELPVMFVCENNGFAEFTPRSAHTNVERVSDVVAPYGLDRETVDGNDVVAVWETFAGSSHRRAPGGGPLLLECLTYRLRGHYEGDPPALPRGARGGRLAGEGPDPAPAAPRRRGGLVRRGRAGALEGDAQKAVEEAVEVRAASPFPPVALIAELTYGHEDHVRQGARRPPGERDARRRARVRARRGRRGGRAVRRDRRAGRRVRHGARAEHADLRGAICGVAIGAAQSGMRPIVEVMFIDFVTLALDQLVNQAAKAHAMSGGQLTVPLVLRTQGGAGRRGARSTHRASRAG